MLWLQLLILVALLAIPFDMIRYSVLGVPFSVSEIATSVAFVLFLTSKKRASLLEGKAWIFSFLLVFGTVLAIGYQVFWGDIVSPEVVLHRGCGILKAWFFLPFLFGWLLYQIISWFPWFRNTVILGIVCMTISVAGVAFFSGFLGGYTYDGRLVGLWQSPNFLALLLVPTWPFFLLLLCRECTLRKKNVTNIVTMLLGSAVSLATLLLTRSYGGIIAADVSALLFFHFGFPKPFQKYTRFLLALVLVGTVLFGTILLKNTSLQEYFSLDSRSSFASRVMIWRSSAKMIDDSPIFGIGPGNFQDVYLAYQQFFPPYLEWAVPEPHNVFLAFWLNSGLIGLIAFLGLLWLWFYRLFQALPRGARLEAAALLAAMSSILVHGLVDTPYWRTNLAFLFWMIFFLGLAVSQNPESKEMAH